ncbi:MAG: OmpA family protein [Candidatus Rokubacteria bacterium]|nr:OmpA family protein [Candidatus Rokubacteria bacterium]
MAGLLLLVTGCATKNWVQELLGKKEAETHQRFATVEGRVSEGSQRVQKLETSVGEIGQTATSTRQRSEEAFGRADAAYARAEEVNGRVTRLWNSRNARDLVETLHVQFGFDRWDLSDAAQTALLSLVKELKENPRLTVDLAGYTDSAGPREYNVHLSQRRVEAVRRYLVERGVELPRIHSIGLGFLRDNGKPQEQEKNRRVTIKLMVAKE